MTTTEHRCLLQILFGWTDFSHSIKNALFFTQYIFAYIFCTNIFHVFGSLLRNVTQSVDNQNEMWNRKMSFYRSCNSLLSHSSTNESHHHQPYELRGGIINILGSVWCASRLAVFTYYQASFHAYIIYSFLSSVHSSS